MGTVEIHGFCDERFEKVKAAMAANYVEHGEIGSSLCIYEHGTCIVDLWAGHADAARSRPWEENTIANVFSATKGPTALTLHMLSDRGQLDLDAPIAEYWPEFAATDKTKERALVRHILTHEAAVPGIRTTKLEPEDFWNVEKFVDVLAKEPAWWEPGTEHGYHALSYGYLCGEVVRRATGKSLGTVFRTEIAEPWGLDFHIGIGPEEDHRIADLVNPPPLKEGQENPRLALQANPESRAAQVLSNPDLTANFELANRREWRAAEIPAAGGHGNGRSLARFYGALANGGEIDGVRVISEKALQRATETQWNGVDTVAGIELEFGLGFQVGALKWAKDEVLPSFGHGGAGGFMGLGDFDTGIGFGFAMNQLYEDHPEIRTASVVMAAFAS